MTNPCNVCGGGLGNFCPACRKKNVEDANTVIETLQKKLTQARQQIAEKEAAIEEAIRQMVGGYGDMDTDAVEEVREKVLRPALKPSPSRLERVVREAAHEALIKIIDHMRKCSEKYHDVGMLLQGVALDCEIEYVKDRARQLKEAE